MLSISSVHGDVMPGSILTWSKRYSDDEVRAFYALAEQSLDTLPNHLPCLLVIAPIAKLCGDINCISGGMSWTSTRRVSRTETLAAELEVTRLESVNEMIKIRFNARILSNLEVIVEGWSGGVITVHNPVTKGAQGLDVRANRATAAGSYTFGTMRILPKTKLSAIRTIASVDIDTCAELTGDFGVQHTTGTAYGKMAQGLLTLISTPLLSAPDVHVTELSLSFLAPVYADNTVTSITEVTEIADLDGDLTLFAFTLSAMNDDGREVLRGGGSARIAT